MLCAVGLILLGACANVSLLSLARGLEDGHDGRRPARLGATRGRLLRQFFTESLVVCGAGERLGVLVAVYAVGALTRLDAGVPRLQEAAVDGRVLGFALLATVLAALVAGLPAAWRRSGAEPGRELGSGTRVASGRRPVLRDALVVTEVALAVVLLVAASLLVRSYERLRAVDPGFDPRGVLVAPIFLDMETYGGGGKSRTYYADLIQRLTALPGVVSAGGATALPGSPLGPNFERPVWPAEAPADPSAHRTGLGAHRDGALLSRRCACPSSRAGVRRERPPGRAAHGRPEPGARALALAVGARPSAGVSSSTTASRGRIRTRWSASWTTCASAGRAGRCSRSSTCRTRSARTWS
jgi:hypothetical protein